MAIDFSNVLVVVPILCLVLVLKKISLMDMQKFCPFLSEPEYF